MIGFFHAKIGENTWGTLLEALTVWYSWKVGFQENLLKCGKSVKYFLFRKEIGEC